MKKFLAALGLLVATFNVAPTFAGDVITYVPYDHWVNIPYCGGQTRLICNGPRRENRCNIEFRDSYNCPNLELYTGHNFYPNYNTVSLPMAGQFYVDNNKISWGLSFRAFMHNADNSTRAKLIYQFDY